MDLPFEIDTERNVAANVAAQRWFVHNTLPRWARTINAAAMGMMGMLAAIGIAGSVTLVTQQKLFAADLFRINAVLAVWGLGLVLILWGNVYRRALARCVRPISDIAETYRFDADGFDALFDGASSRFQWRIVDQVGLVGTTLVLRIGAVLHIVSMHQIEDADKRAAVHAAIMRVWKVRKEVTG